MTTRRTALQVEGGRIFREAWIDGVQKHYPDEPKESYIAPWDEMPEWERSSATTVHDQVRAFVRATDGRTDQLNRAQKGRFVALCWTGQIFKHFPDPKPAYVADWDELPRWQQETDADIFVRIEQESQAPRDHQQPQP
jgi:hypothetical protein